MTTPESPHENKGTDEHGQAGEFVDTPENQPGDQESPPPGEDHATGRDQAAVNREVEPPA